MAKTIRMSSLPITKSDGLRGDPQPGFFERWNFEAALDDGTAVALAFFTKPLLDRASALNPGVSITITLPDGRRLVQAVSLEPGAFSASRERCLVRVGESYARCDDDSYELRVHAGDLSAQFQITPTLPAWQPSSGLFTGEDNGQSMGWIVPIPRGSVRGILTYNGRMHSVHGNIFHDHRWGNADLNRLFSRWYIGRAYIDDTTLLFSQIIAAEEYGSQVIPALLLAQNNAVLVDACEGFSLQENDFIPDPGGRSYPNELCGIWSSEVSSASFRITAPTLLYSYTLVDFLPTWKRVMDSLRWNPYHFRFRAGIDLDLILAGQQTRQTGLVDYAFTLLR